MQKIKNIEFLRIIGCLAIVFLHLFNKTLGKAFADVNLYQNLFNMTYNGQKAVDLFFILSGLFFAWKLNTKYGIWDFVKKKLIRLWPVMIFLLILTSILAIWGFYDFNPYDKILALVGLNGTGWILEKGSSYVGVFWYVSAMFWVLLLFYYLRKYFDKTKVDLFIAICVYFAYAFLLQAKGGRIGSADLNFYYIFNVGMLRAIGGIGLGYFIGDWYKNHEEKIKNVVCTVWQKLFITVIEFMCLYFIINNLMLHKIKYENNIIFIVTFVIIIMLFLLNQGYISRLLNNTKLGNVCEFCAKYTYSIYMTHFFVIHMLKRTLWKSNVEFVTSSPVLNL